MHEYVLRIANARDAQPSIGHGFANLRNVLIVEAHQAQRHQHVEAGDARRTRAGGRELHVLDLLA